MPKGKLLVATAWFKIPPTINVKTTTAAMEKFRTMLAVPCGGTPSAAVPNPRLVTRRNGTAMYSPITETWEIASGRTSAQVKVDDGASRPARNSAADATPVPKKAPNTKST